MTALVPSLHSFNDKYQLSRFADGDRSFNFGSPSDVYCKSDTQEVRGG